MMMKSKLTSLVFGATLAGIGWALWWPEAFVNEPKSERVILEPLKRQPRAVDLMERLRKAATDGEKLALIREAAELSPELIEKLLNENFRDGGVPGSSFGTTVMLIAWGRINPIAALDWAWGSAKTMGLGGWEQAWNAVGSEWAINDSESFFRYVVDHLPKDGESYYTQNIEMNAPLLQFGVEFEWLLRGNPGTFMKAWHRYSRWGSGVDEDFVKSLEGVEEYEVVLSTWDDMSPETTEIYQDGIEQCRLKLDSLADEDPKHGRAQQDYDRAVWSTARRMDPKKNALAQGVVRKWMEEDPESFAESRFAEWSN